MKRPAHPQTLPPTGLVRTLRPGKLLSWERMKPSSNSSVSTRAFPRRVGTPIREAPRPRSSTSRGTRVHRAVGRAVISVPAPGRPRRGNEQGDTEESPGGGYRCGYWFAVGPGCRCGRRAVEKGARCLRTIPRGLASVHSSHPGLSPARDPTARNSLSLRRSGTGRQPERTPRAPHPDPAPGLPRSDQESANRGFGLDGSRYNGGWLGLCRPCRPESRSP